MIKILKKLFNFKKYLFNAYGTDTDLLIGRVITKDDIKMIITDAKWDGGSRVLNSGWPEPFNRMLKFKIYGKKLI